MDVHQDSALTIMSAVLVILLWAAAWTWVRFAKRPDEQRENVGYAMAAVLGYSGLIIIYLLLIYQVGALPGRRCLALGCPEDLPAR